MSPKQRSSLVERACEYSEFVFKACSSTIAFITLIFLYNTFVKSSVISRRTKSTIYVLKSDGHSWQRWVYLKETIDVQNSRDCVTKDAVCVNTFKFCVRLWFRYFKIRISATDWNYSLYARNFWAQNRVTKAGFML